MKPIPINPETEALARRMVWFEAPVAALAESDPFHGVCDGASHAGGSDGDPALCL